MYNSHSKILVYCSYCGKELMRNPCWVVSKRNFCSYQHKYLWNKNKSLEEVIGEENTKRMKQKLEQQTGAKNPNYGNKWSEKQKKIQSELVKNKMKSKEIKYKVGSANRGKKFSKERCNNISKGHKGLKYTPKSEEGRRNVGIASAKRFTIPEFRKKFRKSMERCGRWVPLDKKSDYDIYFKESDWIERMFDRCSEDELLLLKEKGIFHVKNNTRGVVRDHMYSRKSGFVNKVFPEILRHPENCQIIPHYINTKKQSSGNKGSDSISLQSLFSRIRQYEGDWREQKVCLNLINKYSQGERWIR